MVLPLAPLVENILAHIKPFRGLATCFDKRKQHYARYVGHGQYLLMVADAKRQQTLVIVLPH